MPRKPGDLTIAITAPKAGKSKKIHYMFKGHKVDVTPRRHRVAPPESVGAKKREEYMREATPERALRKMTEQSCQVGKRHLAGQVPSIMAKRTVQPDIKTCMDPVQKIERSLNDEAHLRYATDALEFLDSLSLFHCYNCDEEWPVFERPWPAGGKQYAGVRAGKSEVLEKHGFAQGSETYCIRCTNRVTYQQMFSQANWQHLGPRHTALSSLTWYESQLIARVHAVMSVLTLTATGMLCFAGHVCNYYQKVMEWVQSLPAILGDKQFFVVKRRKSLRQPVVSHKQKTHHRKLQKII